MEIRLQKALAEAGVASRRHAEALIDAGRVEVNGKVVREQGTKVDPARDLIRVDGKLLERERKVYFVLFKPVGTVTTLSDPQGRPTIKDLVGGIPERVFAVGRLDFDAEGALLLTNDGELANRLMHPRYGVPRVYLAKVKGVPDEQTIAKLRSGVRLEDGMARPESVALQSETPKNTWLQLTLTEGRPHLVKRLCAAVGHPVVRLFRPQYAGIGVEGLRPGAWRRLTPEEVEGLRHIEVGELPAAGPLKLPPRQHRVGPKPGEERDERRPSRASADTRPARHDGRPSHRTEERPMRRTGGKRPYAKGRPSSGRPSSGRPSSGRPSSGRPSSGRPRGRR